MDSLQRKLIPTFHRCWLIAAVLAVAAPSWAANQCANLFSPHSDLRIQELLRLRQDIELTSGPVAVALAESLHERLRQLSAAELTAFKTQVSAQRSGADSSLHEKIDSATKKLWRDDLLLFPNSSKRLTLGNDFNFSALRASLLKWREMDREGYALRNDPGVQWGAEGRFVLIRGESTQLLDLQTMSVRTSMPAGQLTLQGNAFLEAVDLSHKQVTRVHDLITHEIREFEGLPHDLPMLTTTQDGLLITKVKDALNPGQRLTFVFDMKATKPKIMIDGESVFVDPNQKHIGSFKDGTLTFYDFASGKKVPHELTGKPLTGISEYADPFSGYIVFNQYEGFLRKLKRKILYTDDLQVYTLGDAKSAWLPLPKTKLLYSRPQNSLKGLQVRSVVTGQVAELQGSLIGKGERVRDEIWFVASAMKQGTLTELIRYDPKTGNFVIEPIPDGVPLIRFQQFLGSQGPVVPATQKKEVLRLYDPEKKNFIELPTGEVVAVSADQEGLLIVHHEPNSQGLAISVRQHGQSAGLEQPTSFASISPDGRWVLLEVNGQLELHLRP